MGAELLTYREASRAIPRSVRTIRYWRQRGMPMGWQIRDGQRVRVVEEKVLKAWFRQRLKNDPAHQWKMRTAAAQAEEARQEANTTRREQEPS